MFTDKQYINAYDENTIAGRDYEFAIYRTAEKMVWEGVKSLGFHLGRKNKRQNGYR